MLRRLSPTRNRWPEVIAFDKRVAELEGRAQLLNLELTDLRERGVSAARRADDAALAEFHKRGGTGRRPEPKAQLIEEEIETKTADRDALLAARDSVLEDKERYVSRHRSRLEKQAHRETEEHYARLIALIGEMEETRAALAESRASELWVKFYPGELAASAPPAATLALGLRKPIETTLGVTTRIAAEGVFAALRADADVRKTAMTSEQRLALGIAEPERYAATWVGTPEDEEQQKRDLHEARERYAREWGQQPGW